MAPKGRFALLGHQRLVESTLKACGYSRSPVHDDAFPPLGVQFQIRSETWEIFLGIRVMAAN